MSNNGPQDSNAVGRVNRDGAGSKTVATPKPVVRLDAGEILASVGEALYRWDIESDVLVWSANIGDVLLVRDVRAISTGRAFAQLLEADNLQARFDAVSKSEQRDEGRLGLVGVAIAALDRERLLIGAAVLGSAQRADRARDAGVNV